MLWEDANNGYYYRDDQVQRMITLSSVCHSWRKATFHIPQLWRHARVNVSSSKIAHGPISSWLSRAGSLPKSLTLVFSALKDSPSDCDLADNPTGRIAKACPGKESCVFSSSEIAQLLAKGPALSKLSIVSRLPQCFMNLASLLETDSAQWEALQSLDSIYIDGELWIPVEVEVPSSSFNFIPPSVTSLSLILPNVHESYLVDVDLPSPLLGNLTTLDLVWNGDFGWVIDLLSSCDKLEDLTIKFMTNVLTEQFDQDDITSWSDDLSSTSKWGGLSRLQKIRFVEFPGHLLECLQHLTFLNLREVSIQLGMDVGWMTQSYTTPRSRRTTPFLTLNARPPSSIYFEANLVRSRRYAHSPSETGTSRRTATHSFPSFKA
jgi:hypothetical protein